MPLNLYLLRHGETKWSLSRRHTSRTDLPLTPQGEVNARSQGRRLSSICFSHVLTSPSLRARRTCELADLHSVTEIESDLSEWNYGDDEGRTSADIHRERPGWNLFLDGCHQGDSPSQVSDRADRLIARLRTLDGNVALFTHGHFGRVLGVRWLGLEVKEAQHFMLGAASLSILGFDGDDAKQSVIKLWNSASMEAFELLAEHGPGDESRFRRRAIDRWENEGGGSNRIKESEWLLNREYRSGVTAAGGNTP